MPEVHMVQSLLEATQACVFLISKSFLLDDTYDPSYLKSSNCFNIFPFKDLITSCSQCFTNMHSVLLQLCKSTLLAALSCKCKRDKVFSMLAYVRAILST